MSHDRHARIPRAARINLLFAVLLAAFVIPRAEGAARVFRILDERDGLQVSEVAEIAQDERGYLWIGTVGGLVRFDGGMMLPWGLDSVRHVVQVLSPAPGGGVLVGALGEPLYMTTATGVQPVRGPRGAAIRDWVDASFGPDGTLWVCSRDRLYRRAEADGAWEEGPPLADSASAFFRIRPMSGDTVFVATDRSLWSVSPRTGAIRLCEIGRMNYCARVDAKSVVILTREGDLFGIDGSGHCRRLLNGDSHGRGLAVRDGAIWASIDQYIYLLQTDAAPEVVAPRPGLPTGRPMLVDREGGLWIGGYRGLVFFPEPSTVTWNEDDGLPSPCHARFLLRNDDALWIGTWYGAGRIDRIHGPRRVQTLYPHSGRFVVDGEGTIWTGARDSGFVSIRGGSRRTHAYPGLRGVYASARCSGGRLWLGTDEGVFLTRGYGSSPRRFTGPPPAVWAMGWDNRLVTGLAQDPRGALWIASGEDVVRAPSDSLALGAAVDWIETRIPGADLVTDLVTTEAGDLWASTMNAGVMRWQGDRWEPMLGNRDLPSLRVHGLVPARSGGVWILCAGRIVRVRERPDLREGWEVLEELSSWEGIPSGTASDLAEDADGSLWIATLAGVVEVPIAARRAAKPPVPVELVGVLVDGDEVSTQQPLRLPHRRNRIEIRFAVLSFRDRSLLRYQFRLGPDEPWMAAREPSLRLVDLHPGNYAPEFRASLDGITWSDPVARFGFRVLSPWYATPWAIAGYALLAFAVLTLAYRIRVSFLLRLERQRTRIAMDLHDEMGSGLGSIGLLASLAADARIEAEERRRLSARIAELAGELGGSLSDIVWSLRRGTGDLESFAMRLAERGRRMFPEPAQEFTFTLPQPAPRIQMDLETQRNLHLILVEVLHNAARHAGARRIELALDAAGGWYRFTVRDDGKGMPPRLQEEHRRGNGLDNIRSRALLIGAMVDWVPAASGGTTFTVLFDPRGRVDLTRSDPTTQGDGATRSCELGTTNRRGQDPPREGRNENAGAHARRDRRG